MSAPSTSAAARGAPITPAAPPHPFVRHLALLVARGDRSPLFTLSELVDRGLVTVEQAAAALVRIDALYDAQRPTPPPRPTRRRRSGRTGPDPLHDVAAFDYAPAILGRPADVGGDFTRRYRCPLHGRPPGSERTPSLVIWPNPGTGRGTGWKCFSCGLGGDVFNLASHVWYGVPSRALDGRDFVAMRDRLADLFPEAVR